MVRSTMEIINSCSILANLSHHDRADRLATVNTMRVKVRPQAVLLHGVSAMPSFVIEPSHSRCSGNFYAQSGIPFNQLIPHPVYGNNEGFAVTRGTAIIPNLGANSAGIDSAIGKSRTPLTWNLDLGAYYPIKISESKQLRFTADWF